jgi:hypothetical protein
VTLPLVCEVAEVIVVPAGAIAAMSEVEQGAACRQWAVAIKETTIAVSVDQNLIVMQVFR